MENRNSYFITGLCFLLASIGLVIFVLFMNSKHNDFDEIYYIHTNTLPAGVRKNTPVFTSGLSSGFVKDIYFADSNQSIIEIQLALSGGIRISKDSEVEVITQLLGNSAILNINRGSGDNFLGDEKRIIKLKQDSLERLETSVFRITQKAEDALDKINKVLGDENSGILAFTNTFASKENARKFSLALSNLELASKNLAQFDFYKIQNEFFALSSDIKGTAKSFKTLSDEFLRRTKNGEFNFKDMLEDSIIELSLTTKALRRTLGGVNDTLNRLEDNPYEFFFKENIKKDEK